MTCLNSLILCLLLTRRQKRSCLQKMLPGAAEAAAIRSGPNGQDWWLDSRAAWDATLGLSRFPMAGTCAGHAAATLAQLSWVWRRVRRQSDKRQKEQQENCFLLFPGQSSSFQFNYL